MDTFQMSIHYPTRKLADFGPPPCTTWTVINFEDDTVRILSTDLSPVTQELLSDWYAQLEYFVSFEKLTVEELTVPSLVATMSKISLSNIEMDPYLEFEIPLHQKATFIEKYLPEKRKQLLLTKQTEQFEKKFSLSNASSAQTKNNPKNEH